MWDFLSLYILMSPAQGKDPRGNLGQTAPGIRSFSKPPSYRKQNREYLRGIPSKRSTKWRVQAPCGGLAIFRPSRSGTSRHPTINEVQEKREISSSSSSRNRNFSSRHSSSCNTGRSSRRSRKWSNLECNSRPIRGPGAISAAVPTNEPQRLLGPP